MCNSRLISIAAALCACSCAPALAGQLAPPPGAVAPTPGPEPRIPISAANTPGDADSIFKITQPGSYYLTADLLGVAGKHGIEIASSGITIDLMGFDVQGVAGALDGVSTPFSQQPGTPVFRDVQVRNGIIRAWPGSGLRLDRAGNALVSDIIAHGNGEIGIWSAFTSQVQDCIAEQNGRTGIIVGSNSTIQRCTAFFNGSNGTFAGIFHGGGGTIADCTSNDNTGEGILSPNGRVTVTGCMVIRSGTDGIRSTEGGLIEGNTVMLCGDNGIEAGQAVVVRGNALHRNGTSTPSGAGIRIGTGGGGGRARVVGNHCTDGKNGIKVDGTGTLVIGNFCSNNSVLEYDVPGGNILGPIITSATIAANSNPAANYEF